MAGVGALVVATSLPANAFQPPTSETAAPQVAAETQSLTVQASVAEATITRDGYTAEKPPPPKPKMAMAAVVGSYTSSGTGAVQWPFPSAPIASGYGPRGGSFHYGIDLFPGGGTPIGAIANGVVVQAGQGVGAFGQMVTVDSIVNGQNIRSIYAHMRTGSIGVSVGQQVSAGQFLGAVGATGRAYGEHLHLEIKVNGAHVDPYVWLSANAG